MARRRLLTGEQWAKFLAVPTEERELIRCTLGRDDLDAIATKRTARSRLHYAVLLCYLHHPGRVPDPDEMPPPALLAFVAHQVGAEPDDYADSPELRSRCVPRIGIVALDDRIGEPGSDGACDRAGR